MAIYTPYFYIIQDKRNGMYYAGAKWGEDAHPSTFMVEGGYTTRSNIINELIGRCGLINFTIRKIRSFDTAEEAQTYETRFLRRVDAKRNPSFYNAHNNDGAMDVIKMKFLMMELYGVDNAWKSPIIKQKILDTQYKKYDGKLFVQTEEYKKQYTESCLEKYGFPFHTQAESVKQKQRDTNRRKYGVENQSHRAEIREQISVKTRETKSTAEWKHTQGRALGDRSKKFFTGKIIITNGVDNMFFDPNEELPAGWSIGRTEKVNQKGRIFITNGMTDKAIEPAESIPLGWWKGRKANQKGRIFITNGAINKVIDPAELIPLGWWKGRKSK